MYKSTELTRQSAQSNFVKGMTLEEYLSKNISELPLTEEKELDQQNLYQSSRKQQADGLRSKNSQYFIDQIDEQSMEDSLDNGTKRQVWQLQKSLKTKQTLIDVIENKEAANRMRINSISIHTTAFNKHSHQKPNFRVKHVSVSPQKKRTQTTSQTGSITLYGVKFGQSAKRETTKVPELVTFYGKLGHNIQQNNQPLKHLSFRKKDSKRNFLKKNHLQINELIQFQSKIKMNYTHRGSMDMRVQGVRDRLNERRNKFC